MNVCEKSYDATMFGENVSSFPTPPNGVSCLTDLWSFCEFTVLFCEFTVLFCEFTVLFSSLRFLKPLRVYGTFLRVYGSLNFILRVCPTLNLHPHLNARAHSMYHIKSGPINIFRHFSSWNFKSILIQDDWLKDDDSNVVLVHCQTGNVPSGLFVASYLVHSRM